MTSTPLSQMKIGYVLKVFPRLSETFVLNEVLELERQGLDLDIFSLKPSTEARYHSSLAQLRSDICHLQLPGSTGRTWQELQKEFNDCDLGTNRAGKAFLMTLQSAELKFLLQAMRLVIEVRRRGISHLHAHFASSATWVCLLAHVMSGVSFSFTAHAKDIYHQDADHFLLSEAMSRAAFVVTVTDYNVTQLKPFLPGRSEKLHRIYNGIRLDEYRKTPTLLNSTPLVLGVGRLVEKKGFRYLIEACQVLKERRQDFDCIIIGGGNEESKLSSQIRELNLGDCVTLMGPQSSDVVKEYMARADVLVLPCVVGRDGNRDALPTVLLEAMALGRPVISTDLSGVTEIVTDGETGFLVSQNNSKELAESIELIINNPGLGSRMGQAGRTKADQLFSLPDNVSQILSLFRKSVQPESAEAAIGTERV